MNKAIFFKEHHRIVLGSPQTIENKWVSFEKHQPYYGRFAEKVTGSASTYGLYGQPCHRT